MSPGRPRSAAADAASAARAAPSAAAGRADRLAELAAEAGLDQLLIADPTNIRYLTGFTGTNALCLLGAESRLFFTDFRYTERAEREVSGWDRLPAEQELQGTVAARLGGRVGFDDVHTSVRRLERWRELAPEGVELVAAGGLVERLRRRKDGRELAAIAAAAALADQVYGWVLERGLAGRTERQVALDAERRMRELGAESPPFPPIVAAAANGALPHAEPGERQIPAGALVVFDMGARLDGYCSDCTRTFATGEPGEQARAIYQLVLEAQQAALAAVRAGAGCREVDAAARAPIAAAGHGERFGHGTGHGVGLEVHEAPRLARTAEGELVEGDVVTVEPGIYLSGRFGVRIEDLVAVTATGHRNLTTLPKDLQIVD